VPENPAVSSFRSHPAAPGSAPAGAPCAAPWTDPAPEPGRTLGVVGEEPGAAPRRGALS